MTKQQEVPTLSLLSTVLWLVGTGIAVIAIGLVIFQRGERFAKRAGRLKPIG